METKFITENTKINIDNETLKMKVEELICELFVDYVNEKYKTNILELKNS